MRTIFKTGVTALCLAAGIAAAAPRAEAAAYLTAAGWYGALGEAVAQYGNITLSQLPTYKVEYQDSFGTWRPGEPNAVLVGTSGYPYTDPTLVQSRPFVGSYGGSTWGSQFTCDSYTQQCLGALRVTFTFPYEIVGVSGQLSLGGFPFLDATNMTELQIASYINTTGWQPGTSTFYGLMLDQPTSSLTVSWDSNAPNGVDGSAFFALANATVVRASTAAAVVTAVPEPASLALFGMGLAGLGMVTSRRRR